MSDPTVPPGGADRTPPEKPFLASLFDTSFRAFITPRIVGVLYVLAMILIALYALVFVAAAFSADTGFGVAVLLIGAPLFFLIGVLYVRVILEVFVVLFRIESNTRSSGSPQPPETG